MKEKDINILIEKFFDGDTTLAEEQQLYTYFKSADVADSLIQYRHLFNDLALLAKPRSKPKWNNFRRLITGIAASLLLLCGGYGAWNVYENHKLNMLYGGSYVIMNGKRIDNLIEIKPYIESTLASANSIEQIAAAQPTAADIEQELMDNISDPEELARIKELLN